MSELLCRPPVERGEPVHKSQNPPASFAKCGATPLIRGAKA